MDEEFHPLETNMMRDDDDEDGNEEDTSHKGRPPEDLENSVDFGEDTFNASDERILRSADKVAIAQMLLRKSKKCAAKFLKAECIQNQGLTKNFPPSTVLMEVLDIFLNPGLSIRNTDTKWLKWLIAAGETPADFYKTVEQFDNPTTCSLVWTADFVAYRCRTCGISPCMSLCLDCFHNGNHKGHDYNMFRSQAGGACDCGNQAVMEPSGFCNRHKGTNASSTSEPPDNMLILAKAIVPRLLLRFILHCREHGNADMPVIQTAVADACHFILFLQELCSRGAAMRNVMTEAFCSPKIYKIFTKVTKGCRYYEELLNFELTYINALDSIPFGDIPEGYEDLSSLHGPLVHSSFLEEFVFWTVKFEFPQKLVCLLLSMRPDSTYEDAFAKAFVQHYSRISVMLVQSIDTDALSHRVVHVSVQLFSDNNLAFRMTDSYHLLHIMILSLKRMMSAICRQSTMHDVERNKHRVVYCGHLVMKNHCYWPLVSDLNNILSFKNIAEKLISDSRLIREWISFLSLFQGMNNNVREMTKHVEYEPQFYYAAFSAELEASASPLWAIISHLKDHETSKYSITILRECLLGLSKWFSDTGFLQPELKVYNQVSFHLPLHRSFALVLRQAVKKQGVKLHSVLPSSDMLSMMLVHPLRVQVAFYEIRNDLWVRNGLQIRGQAMTYIQCHFCNIMVDPDLYLLQIGAGEMPKDAFCLSIFERKWSYEQLWDALSGLGGCLEWTEKFHSLDPLCFSPAPVYKGRDQSAPGTLDMENKITMLESCLTFLAMITTNRHTIGLEEEEIVQLEMTALICMGDKTHSQMMDHVPEKCLGGFSVDFESILNKVTRYCQPECAVTGAMKQGTYVPQDHVWEDSFDPIFTQLRALQKKDYQNALNRYRQFCRDCKNFSKSKSSHLWPPYRLPSPVSSSYIDPRRILSCRTFHAIIFVLFYKCLSEPGYSENLLSLTVYLLELSMDYQSTTEEREDYGKELTSQRSVPMEDESRSDCPDGLFYLWYSSDDLFLNATVELDRVQLKTPVVIHGDSVTAQDDHMGDIEMVEIESGETLLQLTDWNNQTIARPLVSGTELVPYQEEAAAVVPSGADETRSRPGSSRHRQALDDSEQRSIMPPTQYPSLLLGSEVTPYVRPNNDIVESRVTTLYSTRPRRLTGAAALPSGRERQGDSHNIAIMPSSARSSSSALVQSSSSDSTLKAMKISQSSSVVPAVEIAEEYLSLKESMISLLLKLHCKLTGRRGSFKPNFEPELLESRIGDGPFFISKVLNKLGQRNTRTREYILDTQRRLYPEGEEGCSTSSEEDDSVSTAREVKRRLARERQKKVMASFARRQNEFMKDNSRDESEEVYHDPPMDTDVRRVKPVTQVYDCVICKQQLPSTPERPVGLVVFIQPTNITGHCTTSPSSYDMPTSDRARAKLRHQRYTLSQYMKEKLETFNNHFNTYSWYNAAGIGYEGEVHVQTCGHHIHLDCQQAYLLSLRVQERAGSSADLSKSEYFCPFCRQLSNAVIPISSSTEDSFDILVRKCGSQDRIAHIDFALKELVIPSNGAVFMKYVTLLQEILIATSTLEFPRYPGAPVDQDIPQVSAPYSFVFITSVFRINLDIELIQRGGSLVSSEEQSSISRRSSLIPLVRSLAFYAKILSSHDQTDTGIVRGTHWIRQVWSSLTERPIMDCKGALTIQEREVPMLCRDPVSILLQIMLLLPTDAYSDYFPSVVLYVYRLVVVRAAVSALRSLPEKKREKVTTVGPLAPLLAMAYNNLRDSPFFYEDDHSSNIHQRKQWSINEFTCDVREICLGFLRIASILKSHIMEESLPSIADPLAECGALEQYLGVWKTCSVVNTAVMGIMCGTLIADYNGSSASSSSVVSPSGAPVETQLGELSGITRGWCAELTNFAFQSQVAAASLMIYAKFHPPRLLNLPHTFEELFQYYHQRRCSQCVSIPKDPALCLICGTLICYKQSCCKRNDIYETVRHANECGAGTGIFLSITQSTIYVIRGTRVAIWGCVYLDTYGEEDRDLKRGKPLYLSCQRYKLLQQQWINHIFDHTPRKWSFHKNYL